MKRIISVSILCFIFSVMLSSCIRISIWGTTSETHDTENTTNNHFETETDSISVEEPVTHSENKNVIETETLSSFIGKTTQQVIDELGENYSLEQFKRYAYIDGPALLYQNTERFGSIGLIFDWGYFGNEGTLTGKEFVIGVFHTGDVSAAIDSELKTDIKFSELKKNFSGYDEAASAHGDYMYITEHNGNDIVFIFKRFAEPDDTAYECLVYPHVDRTY